MSTQHCLRKPSGYFRVTDALLIWARRHATGDDQGHGFERSATVCLTRTQSERVHLVAGRSDIGDSIRQLRLRHRQWIEGFAQQLDLTSLCDQVPSKQMMDRSAGRGGACVRAPDESSTGSSRETGRRSSSHSMEYWLSTITTPMSSPVS